MTAVWCISLLFECPRWFVFRWCSWLYPSSTLENILLFNCLYKLLTCGVISHFCLGVSVFSAHLRSTPPNSEALRHSGGDSLLWTSPTVTLYLDVELRRDRRPGTEQKTSAGLDTPPRPKPSLPRDRTDRAEPFSLDGTGTRERQIHWKITFTVFDRLRFNTLAFICTK